MAQPHKPLRVRLEDGPGGVIGLRTLIKVRGIENQRALAEQMGVHEGTVSRMLDGQSPSPKVISALMKVFPMLAFDQIFDVEEDEEDAPARRTRQRVVA